MGELSPVLARRGVVTFSNVENASNFLIALPENYWGRMYQNDSYWCVSYEFRRVPQNAVQKETEEQIVVQSAFERFAGECCIAEAERVAKFMVPEQGAAFVAKHKRKVLAGDLGLYTSSGKWTEWGAMVREWFKQEVKS